MSSAEAQSCPEKFAIAVFGKDPDFNKNIGEKILGSDSNFDKISNFLRGENDSFRIISTSEFFEENYLHPGQQMIDFMALSDPGPHQFILAISSENTNLDDVQAQIKKLKDYFGEKVTECLVVVKDTSCQSLTQSGKMAKIQVVTLNEKLSSECKDWCKSHQPFQYDYKVCCENAVKRRKKDLESTSCDDGHPNNEPETTGESDHSPSETVFNIVLLGKSGAGKSASANTILAAADSQQSVFNIIHHRVSTKHFKSFPSSTPVTTECEVKTMKLGTQFRVVDTPDFFYEEERVDEAQLEECKKYCQPGQCVVLLVLQLGRFTDGEIGILEKLEEKLGWEIRESTIILFTHGENLKGEVEKFIGDRKHLKDIVEACGNRYHVFKNTSKDSKQVTDLIKKYPQLFPDSTEKQSSAQCCLC